MKGSCLCKTVAYEVKELSTSIVHCSCNTCRKAHSAAFNTAAGVKPEHFKWITGEDKLASFESSPGKNRYFCSLCGSHLVAIKDGAPYYVLRVASLDDDPLQKPSYRIWKSHEVDWLDYQPTIPEYNEWESGRE
jgi:ADP-ribosyl-[dinitrogen reductase] hydrolase